MIRAMDSFQQDCGEILLQLFPMDIVNMSISMIFLGRILFIVMKSKKCQPQIPIRHCRNL